MALLRHHVSVRSVQPLRMRVTLSLQSNAFLPSQDSNPTFAGKPSIPCINSVSYPLPYVEHRSAPSHVAPYLVAALFIPASLWSSLGQNLWLRHLCVRTHKMPGCRSTAVFVGRKEGGRKEGKEGINYIVLEMSTGSCPGMTNICRVTLDNIYNQFQPKFPYLSMK